MVLPFLQVLKLSDGVDRSLDLVEIPDVLLIRKRKVWIEQLAVVRERRILGIVVIVILEGVKMKLKVKALAFQRGVRLTGPSGLEHCCLQLPQRDLHVFHLYGEPDSDLTSEYYIEPISLFTPLDDV